MRCRHLVASEESYKVSADGAQAPVTVRLCNWADSAPSQLLNVPRWMQRNAIAGHLWEESDCAGCPCFDASPIRERGE